MTLVVLASPKLSANTNVGTNLWIVTHYGHFVFNDAFKQARPWITGSNALSAFDTGQSERMPLDADGWPTKAPFAGTDGKQHYPFTVFARSSERPMPTGTWHFIAEGHGTIRYNMDRVWKTLELTGGLQTFTITRDDPNRKAIFEIIRSDPNNTGDYIRNIRLIAPGYYDSSAAPHYTTETFNPDWYRHLQSFQNLRFMDWAETNDSKLATWSARTTPESYTQASKKGVAVEYWVELANQLNKDLWICIPHLADEAYVRNLARLIDTSLNPGLRVYVEYSNEVWNTQFEQTEWVTDEGKKWWPSADINHMNYAYARKSAWIWGIFLEEFSDDSRVIKTLAGHSENFGTLRNRVEALQSNLNPAVNPNLLKADTLAIAPYLSFNTRAAEEDWESRNFLGGDDGRPNIHRVRWVNQWQTGGSIAPKIEENQAVLNRNATLTRTADLSDSTSGKASFFFDWSASGLESGDAVEAQVNDGSGWRTVFRADNTEADGKTQRKMLSPLPADLNMAKDFKIRFRVLGNDADDRFMVDNIHLNILPSIDFLLDEVAYNEINTNERDNIRRHVALCNELGVALSCYEGGQHFTAVGSSNQDTALIDTFTAAQKDPRMRARYTEYFDMMNEEGVVLFNHFSEVSEYGNFGAWGMLESIYQSRNDALKYDATLDWIERNPGDTSLLPTGYVENPSKPLTLSLDQNTVSLQWPDYNGNGNLTNYRIKRDDSTLSWWTTNSEYTDPEVANGTYTYTVIAWDDIGKIALQTWSADITVDYLVPIEVTASVSGNTVSLDWPNYTGDGVFTNFRIRRNDTVLTWWEKMSQFTDSNVPNGTHIYTIIAWENSTGTELQRGTTTVEVNYSAPLTTSVNNSRVTIEWPAYSGSGNLTNYQVRRNGAVLSWWELGSAFLDTEAHNGTHTYTVTAWDNDAQTALQTWTGTAAVSNPSPLPFNAAVENGVVTLDWLDYNGDGAMTNYRVRRNNAMISWWETTSGYVDTPTEPGDYTYTITAWDDLAKLALQTWRQTVTIEPVVAPKTGALIEIDPWIKFDGFDFRATNTSTVATIRTVTLTVEGGAKFDAFATNSDFTISPDPGINGDGFTEKTVTLTFTDGGLAPDTTTFIGGKNDYNEGDIDGLFNGLTLSVEFSDGTIVSGTMLDAGDSSVGDIRRFFFETDSTEEPVIPGPATSFWLEAESALTSN